VDGFEVVIGLEVHAGLDTRTKLFCGCPSESGAAPNANVCPVCLGLPGALPRPNREAVRLAVRFCLAIGAVVTRRSRWSRKSYFYPDLPKGYQIAQHEAPLARGGRVRIEPAAAPPRWIGMARVQIEEDAARLVHEGFESDSTGIDFNRCGRPLLEIVSLPRITTPEEACLLMERIRATLRHTGVSRAEMERGTLRCDANVSIRRPSGPLGVRTEIKNLNSLASLRRALEYEVRRQRAVVDEGRPVESETLSWDGASRSTRPMRGKETDPDYRYLPEPDLPPLVLDEPLIAEAGRGIPESVHERRDRFVTDYGIRAADAGRLAEERDLADYFEEVARRSLAPRRAASWLLNELPASRQRASDSPGRPAAERLAELVTMIESGEVSGRSAKLVLERMIETGRAPGGIVAELGLARIADEAEIEPVCRSVVRMHPEQVSRYRGGYGPLLEFFVGQVMSATEGRASPALTRKILVRLLDAGD
jgi:aspartyl-tRNA(Asn)/glutamyl-tRNA(Gln) amidotransferase subunit B